MALKIWVTVKPQSKKLKVKKTGDSEFLAFVLAPAREGKANRALIDVLANDFSVRKSSVRIIRGLTTRKKLIEIG